MKIKDIYNYLDKISPFDTQEAWDNSVLLQGSLEMDIQNIYLALDLDHKMLDLAKPNSLFITHHPLIFKGLKQINDAYPSSLLKKLILKNISLICMHTNYDKSHLNDYFIQEILGFKVSYKDGFLAYVEKNCDFASLAKHLKKSLEMDILRGHDAGCEIKKIAICTGAGGDLMSAIDAQCFISGDIKYHQAFEAVQNKISFFDVGHFESERYFANSMAKNLQNLEVNCIICKDYNPFSYV